MSAQKEAFEPSEYYCIKEIKSARDFSTAVTHLIKKALAHERHLEPTNLLDKFLKNRFKIEPTVGIVANTFARYDSSTDTGFATFDAGRFDVEDIPELLQTRLLFIAENEPEDLVIKASKLDLNGTTTPTIAIFKGEDSFAVQRKGDIISITQNLPEEGQGEAPLFLRNQNIRLEFAQQVVNFANDRLKVFMEGSTKP